MFKWLLCVYMAFFVAQTQAKSMVFVHSYHFGYPWVQEYRSGFFDTLDKMEVAEFQMDTKRRAPDEFKAIAEQAWSFVIKNAPDVVVVSDDNALKYLGPRLSEQGIPFFFMGVNANPRNYIPITDTVSGVLERPLVRRSVYMIGKVLPDVKRIRVLMDSTVTSNAILETSFGNKLNQTVTGIEVDTKLVSSWEQWQQFIFDAKYDGYDAVVIANYAGLKDRYGRHHDMDSVSEWTSEHSELPLFAFWAYSVGKKKAVGGLSISATQQGIVAAQLVNQYFEQQTMPMITTPEKGAFVFSQSELDRWKLHLPAEIHSKARMLE
ncbi:ABC transporter substrate-binding protein [Vibrio tapetis]|uniref:ABC-type sugar transport system, ATPase component n=1 Tax=Vibrio tapetis subsp. tapetis TaxID=1671868 RepID=A0A2N8ZA39_9VIBR|nr:hypothetical protein [Vibrio tapetis]SON48766.1 ABC-type sugar transport system, ATPase component [Vibrio tapetis subsp. tapetis]